MYPIPPLSHASFDVPFTKRKLIGAYGNKEGVEVVQDVFVEQCHSERGWEEECLLQQRKECIVGESE